MDVGAVLVKRPIGVAGLMEPTLNANRAFECESIKICGVAWPALRKAGRLDFFSH